MHYAVALLFCLLPVVSVGTAAPLSVEVVKMKSRVKWMAEQLVARLNRDFQAPVELIINQSTDDLNGPLSIATILEGYNSLISDTFVGVTQIKMEISSLVGYLDHWRQGHCSENLSKPSLPKPLEELQNRKEFVVTVSMEALMRVKEFLSVLLKNLDRLETC